MAVELTGFSELIGDLAGMVADLDNGPGVDRALQAGAVPIEEQMLANASSDPKIITGALHGSIHTHKVKQSGGGKQITIGVKHSEAGAFLRKSCGARAWRTRPCSAPPLCAPCI